MRRTVGPFLTAGVMLAGATTIVFNPLTVPSTDVRVSTTDLASGHSDLDLLDHAFAGPGSALSAKPDAAQQFGPLLSEMVGAESKLNSVPITGPVAADPVLALSILAVTPISASSAGPIEEVPANTAGLLRALAIIGTSFGGGGSDFIEQVGTAPDAISELAQQVQTGQLEPDAAIRRLATASVNAVASGAAPADGNMVINEVFTEDALAPIIDAMTKASSPQTDTDVDGTPSQSLVSTDSSGITDPAAAAEPTATAEPSEEQADGGNLSAEEIEETVEAGGNLIVQSDPTPHRNRAFQPGQVLRRIGEGFQQRLEQIQEQLAPPATGAETGESAAESGTQPTGATQPGN